MLREPLIHTQQRLSGHHRFCTYHAEILVFGRIHDRSRLSNQRFDILNESPYLDIVMASCHTLEFFSLFTVPSHNEPLI